MNEAPQTPATPAGQPPRQFAPCPCGKVPERLILEVDQNSKVGRAVCPCGQWGIDFLRGVEGEPEKILDKAHAAWDAAPRSPSPAA